MREVLICEQWTLSLPDHRAGRREWPWWEKERLTTMNLAISPGDIIYDVGTEEGDISGLLAKWCNNPSNNTGRIHLFEPNPRVWPNIRAIWEANNLPMPGGCFVGFAADTTFIYDDPFHYPANDSLATWPECAYGPLIGDHGFCNLSERPDISKITLDDYAAKHKPPDVITIDVEGAELKVLQGASNLLMTKLPLVFVSVHPEFMFNEYKSYENELHYFMKCLGYNGYFLAHDHETHYLFQHPSNERLAVTKQKLERIQKT